MKKILSITAILIGTLSAFAQAPEKMSYQAIIRNASGQLLQNQNAAVKVSVLQGSATGTVVYSERLTGTTNANGLLSMEIGSGTVLSGTFNSINWSSGNYWLKTETDPTGGTNYTIAGTSQLLSVPYAMYAKSSGGGGFTLPYSGTSSADNVIPFRITNSSATLNQAGFFENTNPTNSAPAVSGTNNSTGSFGVGVQGRANSNTNGNVSAGVSGYLMGTGDAGAGVFGSAQNAVGVYGDTNNGYGVRGVASGTGTAGSFQSDATGKALSTWGALQFGNINAAAGRVLTASDASGTATWQNVAAIGFPIVSVQDNYTATDNDYTIRFVATSNAGINKTITLPAASGKIGRIYKIYAKIPLFGTNATGSYSTLTISENGTGKNILFDELGVSVMMNRHNRFYTNYLDEYIQFSSVTVQSDGTAWRVIDENYRYFRDYWNTP